jgi:sorting nexin-4
MSQHRNRSDDLYHQAMYESIRVHVPHQPSEHSSASSTSATPQSSPTLTTSPTESWTLHAPTDPDFGFIDDFEDSHLESKFIEPDPHTALLSRNMAADFSEGRLETFVGKPQKELPGTKDAYVSYLVTTKVGT